MSNKKKHKIKVIDNFLPLEQFKSIQDFLSGSYFPWHYNDKAVDKNSYRQFVHNFYRNTYYNYSVSPFMDHIKPLLDKLDPAIEYLFRIKANSTFPEDQKQNYYFHKDFSVPGGMAAVYYINTNDGATVFPDNQFVESKENRIVIFSNEVEHGVKRHSFGDNRIVININWLPFVG
tara:strand:+ start:87 stop:611 length:525 start_codon:yes stop_codon:yes gene_type:complete